MKKFVLFFIFIFIFIEGCTKLDIGKINEESSGKMLTAKVKVTELDKDRTHSFVYYFDKARGIAAVEGGFSIDGKEYPGRIFYLEDKSVLFRPKPDQCVLFPKNYAVYGFMPPNAVMEKDYDNLSFEVNVSEKDEFSMRYSVFSYDSLQKSVVEVSKLRYVRYNPSVFEVPEETECFEYEGMIKI